MHPSMDGFLCLHEGTFEESLMVIFAVMMRYRARTVVAGRFADI
jgi:hypothetical protein